MKSTADVTEVLVDEVIDIRCRLAASQNIHRIFGLFTMSSMEEEKLTIDIHTFQRLLHEAKTNANEPVGYERLDEAFEMLECEDSLSSDLLTILEQNVWFFASMGFDRRGFEIISRWTDAHNLFPGEIERLLFVLGTHFNPVVASIRLRYNSESDLAELELMHFFLRGQLERARAVAERYEFFARSGESALGFVYSVWTVLLQGQIEMAGKIFEESEQTSDILSLPFGDLMRVLVLESSIASSQHRYRVASAILEDLCELSLQREQTYAHIHTHAAFTHALGLSGEYDLARAHIEAWPQTSLNHLVGMRRSLVKSMFHNMVGEYEEAHAASLELMTYVNPYYLVLTYIEALVCAVLSATLENRKQYMVELTRISNKTRSIFCEHAEMLIDVFERYPRRSGRQIHVLERDSFGKEDVFPLIRLIYPASLELADLYYDTERGAFYVRGENVTDAFTATQRKILETLIEQPNCNIHLTDLYQRVWQESLSSAQFENKTRVAVHRLRKSLRRLHPKNHEFLAIVDGVVSLGTPDSRIVVASVIVQE